MLDATVPRISHRRTRPMNWLLGEKNARGTLRNYPPPAARSTLINRQLHYLEEAMEITKAWPAEEEAVRKGYADAEWAIRPLKRAKDGDDEWETPSPTQKPRREGLGEGLGEGLARNLRRDAVDTGDPERGRPRTTAFQCSEHTPEGSCLFFEKQGFCCEKPRGGDGTGTVMGTESTYQVTYGDHVYYLASTPI